MPLFLLTYRFTGIIFYVERVKTKETAVKRTAEGALTEYHEHNLWRCNKISLHYTIFIISMASKMADFKDFRAPLTRVL